MRNIIKNNNTQENKPTEEEKVNRAKEIAHNILLEIGDDEIMNRVIRSELHKHMLINGEG